MTNPTPDLPIRDLDPKTAIEELKKGLAEADERVRKLEEAQIVTHELLRTEIRWAQHQNKSSGK